MNLNEMSDADVEWVNAIAGELRERFPKPEDGDPAYASALSEWLMSVDEAMVVALEARGVPCPTFRGPRWMYGECSPGHAWRTVLFDVDGRTMVGGRWADSLLEAALWCAFFFHPQRRVIGGTNVVLPPDVKDRDGFLRDTQELTLF